MKSLGVTAPNGIGGFADLFCDFIDGQITPISKVNDYALANREFRDCVLDCELERPATLRVPAARIVFVQSIQRYV